MLDTYFSLPTSDYFLRSRCGITELNECILRLVKYIAKLRFQKYRNLQSYHQSRRYLFHHTLSSIEYWLFLSFLLFDAISLEV